ncbi:MAG: hypothetical protein AB1324_05575, partial [Candidatus Micrarchaeota archaeon]
VADRTRKLADAYHEYSEAKRMADTKAADARVAEIAKRLGVSVEYFNGEVKPFFDSLASQSSHGVAQGLARASFEAVREGGPLLKGAKPAAAKPEMTPAQADKEFRAQAKERAGELSALVELPNVKPEELRARQEALRKELERISATGKDVDEMAYDYMEALRKAGVEVVCQSGTKVTRTIGLLTSDLPGFIARGEISFQNQNIPAGSKLVKAEYIDAAQGALVLTVRTPSGEKIAFVAKAQDLTPERTGARLADSGSHVPAPEVATKVNGKELTFLERGQQLSYGIMQHMQYYEGVHNIGGRDVHMKAASAAEVAQFEQFVESNPALKKLRAENPDKFWKMVMNEFGWAQTGLMSVGFQDGHGKNMWAMMMRISEADAAHLESLGHVVVRDEKGPQVLRFGRIDTDSGATFVAHQRDGRLRFSGHFADYGHHLRGSMKVFMRMQGDDFKAATPADIFTRSVDRMKEGGRQWQKDVGSSPDFDKRVEAILTENQGTPVGIGITLRLTEGDKAVLAKIRSHYEKGEAPPVELLQQLSDDVRLYFAGPIGEKYVNGRRHLPIDANGRTMLTKDAIDAFREFRNITVNDPEGFGSRAWDIIRWDLTSDMPQEIKMRRGAKPSYPEPATPVKVEVPKPPETPQPKPQAKEPAAIPAPQKAEQVVETRSGRLTNIADRLAAGEKPPSGVTEGDMAVANALAGNEAYRTGDAAAKDRLAKMAMEIENGVGFIFPPPSQKERADILSTALGLYDAAASNKPLSAIPEEFKSTVKHATKAKPEGEEKTLVQAIRDTSPEERGAAAVKYAEDIIAKRRAAAPAEKETPEARIAALPEDVRDKVGAAYRALNGKEQQKGDMNIMISLSEQYGDKLKPGMSVEDIVTVIAPETAKAPPAPGGEQRAQAKEPAPQTFEQRLPGMYEEYKKGTAPKDPLDAKAMEYLHSRAKGGKPTPEMMSDAAVLRNQAEYYAGRAEPGKPLPGNIFDVHLIERIRVQAAGPRKGDSLAAIAFDNLRSVGELADSLASGKMPTEAEAKALGYKSAADARHSIELARTWVNELAGGTPQKEHYMQAALAVRGIEEQARTMTIIEGDSHDKGGEFSPVPPYVSVRLKMGEIEFTVNVFKDRVNVQGVNPEHAIGVASWPNEATQIAMMRYIQDRFRGPLTRAFAGVMREIPKPGASSSAWGKVYDAVGKAKVDLAKGPPPMPKTGMKPEGIVENVRTLDYAARADAADSFLRLPEQGKADTVRMLREQAKPAEKRALELHEEAGKFEIKAGEFEAAGKPDQANAARQHASLLREEAKMLEMQNQYWHDQATYFEGLRAMGGEPGKQLAAAYGVKQEALTAAFARASSTADAMANLYKALGIKLDALPPAEIRNDRYKSFSALSDDYYLSGMMLTGGLLGEVGTLLPGGKVTGIEFMNGLVGAYRLTVEMPDGSKVQMFAKRQDLTPDQTGGKASNLLGAPAPEVITTSGNKPGGKPYRFVGPDGVETSFGIMRDMRDFNGEITIAGRSVKVKVEAAESLFDIPHPTQNQKRADQRDALLAEFRKNPDSVLEDFGYFQTAAALGGFYDRHELNVWFERVTIDEPPAQAKKTAEYLRSKGYDVRENADGSYSFRRVGGIDSDTFGSYRGVVGGWLKMGGNPTADQINSWRAQGYEIRQEADGSYSFFEAGAGNEVSLKAMSDQFVTDLHRFFARLTYVMNAANMKEGRPLVTVEQVVRQAFGENMDGPWVKGMKKFLSEFDPSTPQGKAFAKRMLEEVMGPFDGKPSGMGSPLGGRMSADLESNGVTYAGGAFNGELNTPITNRDGRATFRSRYEGANRPAVTEAAPKGAVAAMPDGQDVHLVRIDNLPARARKAVVAAVRAGEKDAPTFKTRTVGGKEYIVVSDPANIPETVNGLRVRDMSITARREGDKVASYNPAAFQEAFPQGKEVFIVPVPAEGLTRAQTKELPKTTRVFQQGLG